ncbi:hypothetical protein HPP92_004894 [Vanilla planifolia]|uniref:Pre-nudix hydrolase domain-containing protein n=1 Tax=Vanilla planifolia TaxID=51239 RepID=A0A835VED4_VANPL|nr:hypothetical protein HPP92_004894 [Vanilla planifolia]
MLFFSFLSLLSPFSDSVPVLIDYQVKFETCSILNLFHLPSDRQSNDRFGEPTPFCANEGFSYHHAEPGYVMLSYWIRDEPCIPSSTAAHQIGAGAFCINGNKEFATRLNSSV